VKLNPTHNALSVIHNPEFINWVINPRVESDCYWSDYLLDNPGKRAEADEARFFIRSFRCHEESLSETEKSGLWIKIIQSTSNWQWRILFFKRFFLIASMIVILSITGRFLCAFFPLQINTD
jgi:hypothetical protein